VEEARIRLGQLADEVGEGEPVVLTRRGRVVAVLLSPSEYDRLLEGDRRLARQELEERLSRAREAVAAAGLDVSLVEDAVKAARRSG